MKKDYCQFQDEPDKNGKFICLVCNQAGWFKKICNPKQFITSQYFSERQTWIQAGRPLRNPEDIEKIFENKCKPCDEFRKVTESTGQCNLCKCLLKKRGTWFNKIAWATTYCPATPPLWAEEPNLQDLPKASLEETPSPQQFKQQKCCGRGRN